MFQSIEKHVLFTWLSVKNFDQHKQLKCNWYALGKFMRQDQNGLPAHVIYFKMRGRKRFNRFYSSRTDVYKDVRSASELKSALLSATVHHYQAG